MSRTIKQKDKKKKKERKTKNTVRTLIAEHDSQWKDLTANYELQSVPVTTIANIPQEQNNNRSAYADNMYNVISSIGIEGKAKTPSSCFNPTKILAIREWETFYSGNGIARRIIDTLANEMTREWIDIDGDDEKESLTKYINKLDSQKAFADLVRWGNLMGGSIIVMLIDDGRELIEPVDLNNIRKIEALKVYDLGQIFLYVTDYYNDPSDPRFNEPELYTLRPIFRGVPSEHLMFKVHESRILKIDGAPMTQFLKAINKGWMAPVMQSYIQDIINLEQAYACASESVHEMIISVYGIEKLGQKMATNVGENQIKKRMDLINVGKSMINAVVIDAETEKFEKITTNVSQIDDLLLKFERKLCAVCGIPHMVLFGEQRGGLANSESGDVRSWYDTIRQKQHQDLLPLLKKLIQYISLADDCEFDGDISEVSPSFNALWQYEEKDLVTMKYQTAQMDALYMDHGVLEPEEIRERFLNDTFDFELQIKEQEIPKNYDQKTIEEIQKKTEELPISNDMDANKAGA